MMDTLNLLIIRELVLSPLSASDISKKLRIPPVKAWRRLSELLKAGLIEHAEIILVGNLEKKRYRAVALKYVTQDILRFEPKDRDLKDAYASYAKIQEKFIRETAKRNEIPLRPGIDPVDFGVYEDLKTFCEIMLDPKTQDQLHQLDRKLGKCKEFGRDTLSKKRYRASVTPAPNGN